MPNVRIGFGEAKASALADLILVPDSIDDFALSEAASVLAAYLRFRDNEGDPLVDGLRTKIEASLASADACFMAGAADFPDGYFDRDGSEALALLSSRHSVRSFSSKSVADEDMSRIAAFLSTAPSACNRQPCRVLWTCDPIVVSQVEGLVPGNSGFEGRIPNWALVTCDRSLFASDEAFQWYVNGGIMLAYFIEGLYLLGMDSCIFQLPISDRRVAALRGLFGASDDEALVAAVGFGWGNDKDSGRRPLSARKGSHFYVERV